MPLADPLAALLALLPSAATAQEPLTPGASRAGTIDETDAAVALEALGGSPSRAERVPLRVDAAGVYTLELRSAFFDAYLVLRDAGGEVLAEDDDGWVAVHSRVTARLEAGVEYIAEVAALGEGAGSYEVALRRGAPPSRTAAQRNSEDVEAWRRVLEERERALGPEHEAVADALDSIGYHLWSLGRFAEALPPMERALAISVAIHGEDHPRTAHALTQVAAQLDGLGRVDEALEVNLEAAAIYERHPDPQGSAGMTLSNLADLLEQRGRSAEARECYERGLELLEAAPERDDMELAIVLNNLAKWHEAQGDAAEAERLYRRAVLVLESSVGFGHPGSLRMLANLASALATQREHAEAAALLELAVAEGRAVLGPRDELLGGLYSDLGVHLGELGRHAAAEAALRSALEIEVALGGERAPGTTTARTNLGAVLFYRGRLDEAEEQFRLVHELQRETLGDRDPATLSTRFELARLANGRGDHAAAEALHGEVFELRRELLGDDHPDTAKSRLGLATCHQLQGRMEEAEPLLRQALDALERRLGAEHATTVQARYQLASLLRRRPGGAAEAERLLRETLAVQERDLGPDHPLTANTRDVLVHALVDLGRGAEAWVETERLCRARWNHARHELARSDASVRSFLGAQLEHAVRHAVALAPDTQEGVDASFGWLSAWKGLVLRTELGGRAELGSALDEDQRAQVARVQHLKAELAALVREAAGAERDARVAEVRDALRAGELELYGALELPAETARTSGAELAARLPQGSAFVDLWVFDTFDPQEDAFVLAHVVRPDDSSVRRVPIGPAPELERRLRGFLAGLAPGGDARGLGRAEPAEDVAGGRELTAALWEPLARALDGAELVFVCPDRFLAELPFEVLPLADGSFLMERTRCVYVDGAVSLARTLADEAARANAPALVAVGGVDYGTNESEAEAAAPLAARLRDAAAGSWPALPGTAAEALLVLELHGQRAGDAPARVLLGAEASEAAFERAAGSAGVLHLATHGYFSPEAVPSLTQLARERESMLHSHDWPGAMADALPPGLLAGVVLAGANARGGDPEDDGYLSATEIGSLDLAGCELVVLSACETGLGAARGGEGLMSVRRAFRGAGARTVVSSLWKVEDEATAELMRRFYERLWIDGDSTLDALHGARLDLLAAERAAGVEPQPARWGAFVLSGEWR